MGLDPADDSYPAGGVCAICANVLFGGTTPDCVMAVVTGMERCPLSPLDPPNGVYLLQQTGDLCAFSYFDGHLGVGWWLAAGLSKALVAEAPILFFNSVVNDPCIDSFGNDLECGPSNIWATGGKMRIFWGPQICKGPCE